MKNSFGLLYVLSVALGLAGCGSSSETGGAGQASGSTVALTGAGSTFVYPAMSKWTYAYQDVRKGLTINYQSVGSGAGIAQLKAGTVDFAASDVAMSDDELKEMPSETVQIPIIAGCVALAYNLPEVTGSLKLSGDVVADIYLGKITTWNDPRIAQQNPGVQLPSSPITVVRRSDGSGTTYIFTDYLSTIAPAWKNGPGKGKSVNWPIGVGGKGTEGVAGLIKQTPGAIGYVELAYAIQTKTPFAALKNKSGNYVEPSIESTIAATDAAQETLRQDIRTSIVDTAAPNGYPIAGFTYALISKSPKDSDKAKVLLEFLKWVLGPGQDMAKELQYSPLPKAVRDLDEAALSQVKTQ